MPALTVDNASGRSVDTPTVARRASATAELTKILTPLPVEPRRIGGPTSAWLMPSFSVSIFKLP